MKHLRKTVVNDYIVVEPQDIDTMPLGFYVVPSVGTPYFTMYNTEVEGLRAATVKNARKLTVSWPNNSQSTYYLLLDYAYITRNGNIVSSGPLHDIDKGINVIHVVNEAGRSVLTNHRPYDLLVLDGAQGIVHSIEKLGTRFGAEVASSKPEEVELVEDEATPQLPMALPKNIEIVATNPNTFDDLGPAEGGFGDQPELLPPPPMDAYTNPVVEPVLDEEEPKPKTLKPAPRGRRTK